MNTIKPILAIILACSIVFFACNTENNIEDNSSNNMRLINKADSWGGDFEVPFSKQEPSKDSIIKITVSTFYNNSPVGFELLVSSKKSLFISDGAVFISTGKNSDNFLKALATIYGLDSAGKKYTFADSIKFPVAYLESDMDMSKPGNWVAAQYKIFLNTAYDEAELYMNVDLKRKIIEFPEKDSAYRRGIIQALSKQ